MLAMTLLALHTASASFWYAQLKHANTQDHTDQKIVIRLNDFLWFSDSFLMASNAEVPVIKHDTTKWE